MDCLQINQYVNQCKSQYINKKEYESIDQLIDI